VDVDGICADGIEGVESINEIGEWGVFQFGAEIGFCGWDGGIDPVGEGAEVETTAGDDDGSDVAGDEFCGFVVDV